MMGKLIKITLTLAVALQMSGAVKAYDSHAPKAQSNPTVSSTKSEKATIASQDHSAGDADEDTSPFGHHHCKSHPTGSCCAYLSSSGIKLIRDSNDHAYGIKPEFFFFELVSSHLRPPSINA